MGKIGPTSASAPRMVSGGVRDLGWSPCCERGAIASCGAGDGGRGGAGGGGGGGCGMAGTDGGGDCITGDCSCKGVTPRGDAASGARANTDNGDVRR